MQQITGTLVSLATYLALVAVGAFLGFPPCTPFPDAPLAGPLSDRRPASAHLHLRCGSWGANEEIVASLGVIGLNAFLITAAAMAGSLLAVHILRKYILKLDKHGQPAGSAQTQEKHGEKVKVDHTLTLLIVFTVAFGMVLGPLCPARCPGRPLRSDHPAWPVPAAVPGGTGPGPAGGHAVQRTSGQACGWILVPLAVRSAPLQ